jgi:glutamate racemase
MKIGIFDSGIGGLIILRSIKKHLPDYDYVYLGDTKRVPYGNRSQKAIFDFTSEAIDFLFKKNCSLVIVACNSASARALRKIQREWLPKHHGERRVLGVIIPTVEEAARDNKFKRIGLIATEATINSQAFDKELKKFNQEVKVFSLATPLLVSLIENNGLKWVEEILADYLKPFKKDNLQALLLGCTHYPIIKKLIRKIVGKKIKVISQDEIIPKKLELYLKNHPEIRTKLSKNRKVDILVTDLTHNFQFLAKKWFNKKTNLKLVKLN